MAKQAVKFTLSNTNEEGAHSKVKALLVGKPKVGKTTLATDFPKPFVIDTDHGLASVVDRGIPYLKLERPTKEHYNDTPCGYMDVRRALLSIKDRKGDLWEALGEIDYVPETIVIDSLTALSDYMEEELVINPPYEKKGGEETLQIQDYNLVQRRLFGIVNLANSLDMHVVCISGVEWTEDDRKKMYENPALTGNKLGQRIPYLFDDVYFMWYDQERKKRMLTTVPTRTFQHSGTRHKVPMKEFIEPDFKQLSQYYYGDK